MPESIPRHEGLENQSKDYDGKNNRASIVERRDRDWRDFEDDAGEDTGPPRRVC